MKKVLITALLIIGISAIAGGLMYYGAGFNLKKSAIIAGGAGIAMLIFDVLIPYWRGKKNDFIG